MTDCFSGKVVVITGGSSGIGLSLAFAALEAGAWVAICGRKQERLQAAFGSAFKDRLMMMSADIRDEIACAVFMGAVRMRFGRIDILINNAGISMRALFADASIATLREVMDTNFWGTVYCTKAALPSLKKSKGIIVGVSSIAGYRGLPARSAYSASKFALQGLMESLRTELMPDGIHVMWVCPGFTKTNIRKKALSADGSIQAESPLNENELMSADECAKRILQAILKKKRTLVLTRQGKLTVWLNKLFPKWADKLVYEHFLKEPASPLMQPQTETPSEKTTVIQS
ncbi:MAG: SDR family oxidoreductase [Bacteroidetes bacterium]|nr:SDR family oxidoreductase [Bacteroidota bacterium]MBS1628671.1 SDR family oxidoreductase [Bacteroidota bacterium]